MPGPDDSILVCLIKHSVMGESTEERRAASLLLSLLRYESGMSRVRAELDQLSDNQADAVADEANRLIARYDLR